jgi:hypothetical protein
MAIYRGTGGSSTTTDETTVNAVNQKAAEAATSASSAASSASSAATSASTANTKASQASTSASSAATSATQASASKDTAVSSAAAAQAAQTAAETAQTAAEAAETNAILYGNMANTAAGDAITAKINAEAAETNAEYWYNQVASAEVNADASAAAAATSESNAAASETAAALSESNASSSETAAAASAIAADASANDAATSEANAAASETASAASAASASTSATTATTQATAASTSASAAATSASNASASESAAAASESAAATSATNAAASESAAATSEANAAASQTAAASSATSAASSATAASSSETNAAASETAAAASETAAAASESAAATSETNAAASQTAAASSASAAATSATNAAASETNAASSETAAATSATAASAAKDAALAALDSFDDRYLGVKSSDPTLDNDGNALVSGALYFNDVSGVMKVYDGAQWLAAYADLSGALVATSNLSDLTNVAAARVNLGLGTAATTASTDYATAAQGALADSALQSFTETDPVYTASSWYTTTNNASNWDTAYGWGNHASVGYITGYTVTQDDVTAHEAALTIAQSQVTGLSTALAGKVDDSQVLTNVPAGAVFTDTTYSVGNGGLTEINFTSARSSKLDGIEAGAEVNVPTNLGSGTTSTTVSIVSSTGSGTTVPAATTTTAGALTAADKTKLDGIATNANNYTHPSYAGDDINLDTGALSGATVISDLDFNVTTDTQGHVTDANATYSTRNLTAADIGAQPAGSYLTTSTSFSGDVSGTYNAIVVANDSHTHDGRYYTESESNVRYAYKAGSSSQTFSVSTLNATTVDLGNWTITESSGVLYFATLGVNKMKLDASGNLTVVGDVTAYGTI